VKAPDLAVAVNSSGVKVESSSQEKGHRIRLPSLGSFMASVLHPFHRRFPILGHGIPARTNKHFCALIHCAACGLIAATTWAGSETVGKVNPPLSHWLAADGITGDWDGMRSTLTADHGVEIFCSYTAEVWGNTVGGLKQGAVYTGLLEFGANVDLEKLIGWKGASIHNNWFWLSGRDASEDLVGSFLTISNIAGFNTLRMDELWFQQNLLDDRISIRLGQIRADTEFVISESGLLFLNATLGFPAFMYTNLPDGGPVYPMGTLGIRLALTPVQWFTFQTAIFEGNKFPQDVNRHGFRYRLNQKFGYFWINEAKFLWFGNEDSSGLPGTFKVGAWFHTAKFANPNDGELLDGNYGFYFIVDQMLYRQPGEMVAAASGKDDTMVSGDKDAKKKTDHRLLWFARVGFEPKDQNFIGFYFDTGLTYKGLIPSRDDDTIGIAFKYAQLTPSAQRSFSRAGSTPAGAEMALEFTYQAQVTEWLTVQPDIQFIINPGGTQDLNNALVIGARAVIAS
jgi:porin